MLAKVDYLKKKKSNLISMTNYAAHGNVVVLKKNNFYVISYIFRAIHT